ncbi:hypothetical protein [Amycolatopsis sp. NPDC051903]|uniref:hypothetical protein n=1 Tax=Amycolatopsis sp. NPDC051903 TaxID=3363936 RepID=UPI0037AA66BC
MNSTLDTLAGDLATVIDGVAASFGPLATPTVDGELDCDPAHPGRVVCWQYGVRVDHCTGAEHLLADAVLPALEAAGWQAHDRSTTRELIARFSREGADFTVHVARAGGAVAIIGSTRCVQNR